MSQLCNSAKRDPQDKSRENPADAAVPFEERQACIYSAVLQTREFTVRRSQFAVRGSQFGVYRSQAERTNGDPWAVEWMGPMGHMGLMGHSSTVNGEPRTVNCER